MVHAEGLWVDVPILPDRPLVGRSRALLDARQRLLDGQEVGVWSGLPGVGKTALAIQLAHDSEIRSRYPDGVLWASLGRDVTVEPKLSKWALKVGVTPSEVNRELSAEQIGELAHNAIGLRGVFLIVDDAWSEEAAILFRIGGSNCVHLLTTRFEDVADTFSEGNTLEIKEIDDEASAELLKRQLRSIADDYPEEIQRCVDAARGLPLSLVLMGKHLRRAARDGETALRSAFQSVFDAQERIHLNEQLLPEERPSLPPGVPVSLFETIRLTDELLDVQSHRGLRHLTVFPPKGNTFSRDAGITVSESERVLHELRERGLLELMDRKRERFAMHQAILDYASEGSNDPTAYRRMALFFIEFVKTRITSGARKSIWLGSLEHESDNLNVALNWAIENQEADIALALGNALWRYWYERSHFKEGRKWLQDILEIPGTNAPEYLESRALALNWLGNLEYNQADLAAADSHHKEALRIREQIEAAKDIAGSLNNLGLVARERGQYQDANHLFDRALKISESYGNDEWIPMHMNNLGTVALLIGNLNEAEDLQREAARRFSSIQSDWGAAMAKADLAAVLLHKGQVDDAAALFVETQLACHEIHDTRGEATCEKGQGDCSHRSKDDLSARSHYLTALKLFMDIGARTGMARSLEGVAVTDVKHDPRQAAFMLEATRSFRQKNEVAPASFEQSLTSFALDIAQQALDESAFSSALSAGAAAELEVVGREALESDHPSFLSADSQRNN
jgi:tetratricopeptide (TPR) repeat protein